VDDLTVDGYGGPALRAAGPRRRALGPGRLPARDPRRGQQHRGQQQRERAARAAALQGRPLPDGVKWALLVNYTGVTGDRATFYKVRGTP
jgi:hypothetical protein